MTVAIMQPYFIPYAGYFRLFETGDLFIIYDCVQFPRRGWVHRNRLPDGSGAERWLTLPLARASRDVRIRDLQFGAEAPSMWAERLRAIPLLAARREADTSLLVALRDLRDTPLEYIERLLRMTVSQLAMKWEVCRSSTLGVPDALRGQDRIIEICRRVGATRYVNSPDGRALYDAASFDAAGIELRFLSEYPGSYSSILRRLLEEDTAAVAADIKASSQSGP